MSEPRTGPETALVAEGTNAEAWLVWPNEPRHRCQWPTAALVGRLIDAGEDAHPYAVRAVLMAYEYLLTHPAGTEDAVQRIRSLRRAEVSRAR